MTCEDCGANSGTRRVCHGCSGRRGAVAIGNHPSAMVQGLCARCGTQFSRKRRADQTRDAFKYCSRTCYFAVKAQHREQRAARLAEQREAKVALRLAPRLCVDCGDTVDTKSRCAACAKKRAHEYHKVRYQGKRREGVCPECGGAWVAVRVQGVKRYCSSACAKKANRRKGDRARGGGHTQRAKRAGVGRKYNVQPLKVFERDKWTCQVCGKRTPRRLRGQPHQDAPELDHIVPLSMGGPHTYDNVQLACRGCNIAKGASWIGQRRLGFDGLDVAV